MSSNISVPSIVVTAHEHQDHTLQLFTYCARQVGNATSFTSPGGVKFLHFTPTGIGSQAQSIMYGAITEAPVSRYRLLPLDGQSLPDGCLQDIILPSTLGTEDDVPFLTITQDENGTTTKASRHLLPYSQVQILYNANESSQLAVSVSENRYIQLGRYRLVRTFWRGVQIPEEGATFIHGTTGETYNFIQPLWYGIDPTTTQDLTHLDGTWCRVSGGATVESWYGNIGARV